MEDVDPLGRLEMGQPAPHELDQLARLRRRRNVGPQDHEGPRHLPPPLVRHPDDGRLEHGGMRGQRLLHLHGRHVLAAAHDDVLLPIDDGDVPLAVDHGHVAGVQPAIPDDVVSGIGPFPVAGHHVIRTYAYLSDRGPVPRDFVAVVVEHAEVDADVGQAGRRPPPPLLGRR